MGFMKPKVATPPPAPNPAMDPLEAATDFGQSGVYSSSSSFIGTTSRGLKRRASTERTSLIGG